MRILGIDLGDRRVGVAVWDDPELPARPLVTLEVTAETLVARVAQLAAHEGATELVVGLPLRLDGRDGLASRRARRAAAAIARATGLPVALEDERLTSSQVHAERLFAVGARESALAARAQGGPRDGAVDARAAAILLQTYVDRRDSRWAGREDDESNGP